MNRLLEYDESVSLSQWALDSLYSDLSVYTAILMICGF